MVETTLCIMQDICPLYAINMTSKVTYANKSKEAKIHKEKK